MKSLTFVINLRYCPNHWSRHWSNNIAVAVAKVTFAIHHALFFHWNAIFGFFTITTLTFVIGHVTVANTIYAFAILPLNTFLAICVFIAGRSCRVTNCLLLLAYTITIYAFALDSWYSWTSWCLAILVS